MSDVIVRVLPHQAVNHPEHGLIVSGNEFLIDEKRAKILVDAGAVEIVGAVETAKEKNHGENQQRHERRSRKD